MDYRVQAPAMYVEASSADEAHTIYMEHVYAMPVVDFTVVDVTDGDPDVDCEHCITESDRCMAGSDRNCMSR